MALYRIHGCPFCPSGQGDLNVDTATLVAMKARGDEGSLDFRAENPNQDVFVFNADRAKQEPCPHLVSLYVDGTLKEREHPYMNGPGVLSPSIDFDHPWLHTELGQSYADFLWLTLIDSPPRSCRPSILYRFKRIDRAIDIRGTTLSLYLTGRIVVALDPDAFLDELPACHQRWSDLMEETHRQHD